MSVDRSASVRCGLCEREGVWSTFEGSWIHVDREVEDMDGDHEFEIPLWLWSEYVGSTSNPCEECGRSVELCVCR